MGRKKRLLAGEMRDRIEFQEPVPQEDWTRDAGGSLIPAYETLAQNVPARLTIMKTEEEVISGRRIAAAFYEIQIRAPLAGITPRGRILLDDGGVIGITGIIPDPEGYSITIRGEREV